MATATKRGTKADQYLELVRKFPLKPIRSDRQLRAAHKVIDELTRHPEETLSDDQKDYLEVLGDLTIAYENRIMSAETASVSGLDILKHLLEANNMTASDLGRLLGNRELGSKILRGQREISKANADALGSRFGLPSHLFLKR